MSVFPKLVEKDESELPDYIDIDDLFSDIDDAREQLEGDINKINTQTKDLNDKLKKLKNITKDISTCVNASKEVMKKVKAKKEPKPKVQKDGVVKLRKIREDAMLYRGGLNFYQYKQSAIDAGFQNPIPSTLRELIKDFDFVPPKVKKSRKKVQQLPEEGGSVVN